MYPAVAIISSLRHHLLAFGLAILLTTTHTCLLLYSEIWTSDYLFRDVISLYMGTYLAYITLNKRWVRAFRLPPKGKILATSFVFVTFLVMTNIISIVSTELLERLFNWFESSSESMTLFFYEQIYTRQTVYLLSFFFIHFYLRSIHFRFLYEKVSEEAKTNAELIKSESLQALSYQINSHFLFNAMNSISIAVRKKEQEKAVNMLAGLSELLREVMKTTNSPFVSVEEEVRMLNLYLQIEEERFKDSVEVIRDISHEINTCKIPRFLLQPIIENAFKHGMTPRKVMKLKISGFKAGRTVRFEIFNSNSVFDHHKMNQGTGLGNTVKRLQNLYEGQHKFQIASVDTGTNFIIEIPFEEYKP